MFLGPHMLTLPTFRGSPAALFARRPLSPLHQSLLPAGTVPGGNSPKPRHRLCFVCDGRRPGWGRRPGSDRPAGRWLLGIAGCWYWLAADRGRYRMSDPVQDRKHDSARSTGTDKNVLLLQQNPASDLGSHHVIPRNATTERSI